MTRATAVFPVPGGPRNTKCCIGFSVPCPAIARRLAASTEAVIERTWSLTAARPIIALSSAIASSTVITGQSVTAWPWRGLLAAVAIQAPQPAGGLRGADRARRPASARAVAGAGAGAGAGVAPRGPARAGARAPAARPGRQLRPTRTSRRLDPSRRSAAQAGPPSRCRSRAAPADARRPPTRSRRIRQLPSRRGPRARRAMADLLPCSLLSWSALASRQPSTTSAISQATAGPNKR